MTLVQQEPKKIYVWTNALKKITMRPSGQEKQIRPVIPPELCFTANTAGSTVKLTKNGSPTAVTLETSADGSTWTTYTIGSTITLSNIWDKVYWRNTSETTTGFTTDINNHYYQFVMTGSIAASWDINYLLNKNSTTTISDRCFWKLFSSCGALTSCPKLSATTIGTYCYFQMFTWCTSLTTASSLPATTLASHCYEQMFYWCTSLTTLPNLPATALSDYCYNSMFRWCSSLRLSTTQTWEYQTPYRIPTTWTWTTASMALGYVFTSTWWSWAWTPSINTTYYTSNTVV